VLDFGCGWGRVTRYFDRVLDLWGVDVQEKAIAACRETIPFARFKQVEPLGPAPFADDAFDLVYAFSVFTHLSEQSHRIWLDELRRVLKPDGLLIVTTQEGEGYSFLPTWGDHFGDTFISESYIREKWPFEVLDYFPSALQMFVVCRNSV
jgi:cyclopropane fatty-acyl-phospholipid synthase-like methyltransferase